MYQLKVYYPGQTVPHALIPVATAAEVLARISALLAEHRGCERVVVIGPQGARLFSVDCAGARHP